MASIEEIRNTRLEKLHILEQKGVSAYPTTTERECTLLEAAEKFDTLSKKKTLALAGRVMSLRPQGGLIFCTLDDGTGRFQGLIKKDSVDAEIFDFFSQVVDIGDFIEVHGTLFLTKRNEKTVEIKTWRMLAKSLRPLPEKWHGLQDIEERFRHRYLDMLMSSEVKKRFIIRSKVITEIRRYFDENGFLEVETPMLQSHAGGATALPFTTHHEALDIEMYLRIAPELFLKRLLVGGFPKVYEIGRNFRNEGIDVTHNPEFTMLEWYEAYSDASKQMIFAEGLLKHIVQTVFGTNTVSWEGKEVDFSKKFSASSYFDLLKKHSAIKNPETVTLAEITEYAEKAGVKVEQGDTIPRLMDAIYKKTCRPKLIDPTFITDYPVEYLPLAKRNSQNPKAVDAFQLVIGGLEVVKAFSELNDPIDQKMRFNEQEQQNHER